MSIPDLYTNNFPVESLKFRKVLFLTPFMQVALIVLFYVLSILHGYTVFQETGLTQRGFPFHNFIYVTPIYEEIAFRGLISGTLLKYTSPLKAIIYSSLLFGIRHLKNIFVFDVDRVIMQILYAGLFVGPIFAYITLKTRTIRIAVILHFLNNLMVPLLPVATLLIQQYR